MKHTKKITILHSNDLHGDFLAEQVDEKLVGGVSMLSGYIEKVRAEEPTPSTPLRAICSAARSSIRSTRAFPPLRS